MDWNLICVEREKKTERERERETERKKERERDKILGIEKVMGVRSTRAELILTTRPLVARLRCGSGWVWRGGRTRNPEIEKIPKY